MCSSSPVRTPKLQLVAEQPLTRELWIPSKKDTWCPRAKEKPKQDGGRGKLVFRIKARILQRCSEGSDKILCTPGPRRKEQWPHKRLSQTCLWVSRSLWWRCGSAVACCRVRGTDYNGPGSHRHKSFWKRALQPLPHQSFGVRPNHRERTQPHPSQQDADPPTASPFPKEAATSLLPSSIRRQTERKAQSQKTKQTDQMNHSLV